MIAGVALPLLAMAVAGWATPRVLGRMLPEGVGWLAINAVLSTILLAAGAAALWVWLYGAAGGTVLLGAPGHLAGLVGRSALAWGPLMALSLTDLPRGWTRARW